MAEKCWNAIPEHYPHVELDEFVVMPNHVHGILTIVGIVGANNYSPLQPPGRTSPHRRTPPRGTSKTIGSVIRGFKIGATKWFRSRNPDAVVWQRNYYEHIVRHDNELNHIREYILNNPMQWEFDRENPAREFNATRPAHGSGPTEVQKPFKPYGQVPGEGWMI